MAQQKMRMITPHSFPADCLTYSLKRAGQDLPALSPEPITLKRFPLGQSPFLQANNMRAAITKAWEQGGADFQSRFDKSTAQAQEMKEGALRVLCDRLGSSCHSGSRAAYQ